MRSNYLIVSLKGFVQQVSVRNKGECDIEVYSVTNSEGFTKSTDYFSKEVFSKDVSNYKVVSAGQFAYNPSRINVGSVDYLRSAGRALVSPLYIVFQTSDEVYPDYLLRFLKSDWGNLQIRANTEGAVRDSLKFKGLENIKIPLPLLDDQVRIAYLLSKVEGLIAQRKRNLQQLDDLLKSVFLDMFGNPARNEKGWEKPELKEFGKIITGNTPPRKDASNYSSRHIEWIKTDNILGDSAYITQATEYLSENGSKKGRIITDGALLVACIAGSLESIGRAALTNRTVAFNQQINAIQPRKDVNSLFLYTLFKISKAYIQSHATKGMKKILIKGVFEKIEMIKPPVVLQDQFGAIVDKIEGIKFQYRQSLSELENLYGALSQMAFKGELDLSRISLNSETEQPEKHERHEKQQEEATAPFEQGLPEHIKATLANLNTFNENATRLKTIQEAARLSRLDLSHLDVIKQVAERLATLRSPLQELEQMMEISKAMGRAQVALKPLNLEQMETLAKSAELARTMAANIPKIDLDWLEQHSEALRKAAAPFESMRRAMESMRTPAIELKKSLRLPSETAKRLQSSIPDFTAWQKQAVDTDASDFDDEDEAVKRPFTREDVAATFANNAEPLSFERLLHQLSELETVDFAGYETIKAILFELLAEQQLTQIFDEEQKTLLLSPPEQGAAP